MKCDACGKEIGLSGHPVNGRWVYCNACCPDPACRARVVESERGRRQVRIALVIVVLLALALIGQCCNQVAEGASATDLTMALCPRNVDCASVIVVTAADLSQVMFWETWQYPPDVQDWLPVPDDGVIVTRALSVRIWSPADVPCKARLVGQTFRHWLPVLRLGGV